MCYHCHDVITLKEYLDQKGQSPFGRWLEGLDAAAAAKVTTALTRIEQGNFSNVKGVGAGVFECRIDFGPATACTSGRTVTRW